MGITYSRMHMDSPQGHGALNLMLQTSQRWMLVTKAAAAMRLYRAAIAISFSEATLRLLDGRNYAVLATVNPDGSPHTSAMWVGRDGDDLLFSTLQGRVKQRNMLRDPRVSVTVLDSSDPENYVE